MASIDNVRVLLQTLPPQQNLQQNEQPPPPAKVISALPSAPIITTPLRARNTQQQQQTPQVLSTPEKSDKGGSKQRTSDEFWRDLYQFHERRGTPLVQPAKVSGQHVDLFKLYSEVTERGGFNKVNIRDEWDEVYSALGTLRERCVNGTAGIKHIYRRYLDKYERLNFFGEDPDKMEALEAAIENAELGGGGSGRSRSRALTSSNSLGSIFGTQHSQLTAVPMSYNHRQHHVNIDRRRQYKLTTELHKHSNYEKLLLSLLSPLPNEQDFAINVCTLMTNEADHTLRLPECPKLLDVLLAHLGVYADYTMRTLFQHGYKQVRRQSPFNFWRDLLHDKPQVLELYTDEQAWLDNGLINKSEEYASPLTEAKRNALLASCDQLNFLNLRRNHGTSDYMGQRVLQIVQIVRNLSFHEENVAVLAKNRTLWRYLVMGANVRWSDIHIQTLETAGNLATEFELHDPTTDELSRSFLATLCEGIDSADRAVIINCLEILYKLCGKEGNAVHINRCLTLDFYQRVMALLSLTDVMLLIFTLEAIYALTSLGARPCSMLMQVRGIIEQLVTLLTVEAPSYGIDGCILMRVVEMVPTNMLSLPMGTQNITELQTATVMNNVASTGLQSKPQIGGTQNVSFPLPSPAQMQVVEQLPAPSMPALPMPSLPQVALPSTTITASSPSVAVTVPAPVVASPKTALVPTATAALTLPTPPSAPQSFTHDDEQYALAWLGAHYERVTNLPLHECRVEQNELYHIYLSHCQKAGKHSVVNHMQFPRLVNLMFNHTVGPAIVRQLDGTELPGTHYVGIKMRPHPLPIQIPKPAALANVATTTTFITPTAPATLNKKEKETVITTTSATKSEQSMNASAETAAEGDASPATPTLSQSQSTPSSSLIKSLLANKVNERQQKQKALVTQVTQITQGVSQPPSLVATTAPMAAPQSAQPIKVTSTAISAFVNNPLMQHTPVKVGQTTIKPLHPQLTLEKKPILTDSAPPPLAPLSGANVLAKDASGRTLIISSGGNQTTSALLKRKLTIDEAFSEQSKRLALETSTPSHVSKDDAQVTPSKNAANLYADLAASILEDEDLDDVPPLTSTAGNQTQTEQQPQQQQQQQQQQTQQQLQLIPAKVHTGSSHLAVQPAQRQLVFPSGGGPLQLKLATHTIKTDQGHATVMLQQSPASSTPPQTQTQYMLATDQRGQAYLVAQQTQPVAPPPPPPPIVPPTQTVLVTQTPQQQGAGTKTIIILQQQGTGANVPGTQKVLMTTAQGQQVLVTTAAPPQTRPTTPQQQTPQQAQQAQQIFINAQRQAPPGMAAGQMSPSLLSQLNQIPATIKLHQPQPPAVMGSPAQRLTKAATLPIPQLQQHESIIQQHLISGPSDKRQVLLSGGRSIEIKETVITQSPAGTLQQGQLNSQTIITTQPAAALQQQQQHIRTVLEQQQQHHPSIIQQKISLPVGASTISVQQQQQQTSNVPALPEVPKPVLVPAISKTTSANIVTTTANTMVVKKPLTTAAPTLLPTLKPQPPLQIQQPSPNTEVGKMTTTIENKPTESTAVMTTPTTIVATTIQTGTTITNTPVITESVNSSGVPVDVNWLYICDWRNCPRRKFKSLAELQHHVCNVHCPDHLDPVAEIYCQWGDLTSLCDNIARRRYALMTHLVEHHATVENLRASMQRRIATGIHNVSPTQPVVTIVRKIEPSQQNASEPSNVGTSPPSTTPATTTWSSVPFNPKKLTGGAVRAIRRNTFESAGAKELVDETEGPVTKSIRLTAALILRNLVNYTGTAKRSLRRHEPFLASLAASNLEASGALSHILYELSQ